MAQDYAYPDVLVDTQWVADHLSDPGVRVVESDEDVLLYEVGHVPGAVKVDWHTDLQQPLARDFISKEDFEKLCSKNGIADGTTVVFYGDKNNWYATYSFWLFQLYGHQNLKVMNGGRQKWIEENQKGRPWFNEIRRAEQDQTIERVGSELRAMMPFLNPVTIRPDGSGSEG